MSETTEGREPPGWLLAGFIRLGLLCACQTPCTENQRLGADRDAHGCIASAGYVWSDAHQRCVRPWEQR